MVKTKTRIGTEYWAMTPDERPLCIFTREESAIGWFASRVGIDHGLRLVRVQTTQFITELPLPTPGEPATLGTLTTIEEQPTWTSGEISPPSKTATLPRLGLLTSVAEIFSSFARRVVR